jgi:uncharacterized membrane protein YedE/YeeE
MLTMFPQAQPVEGLIGGLLIGVSSALMLLGAGRIAGISGLASRAIGLSRTGTPWSMAVLFIGGLLLGAFLFQALTAPIEAHYAPSAVAVIAAGLLTGFGTRLGSGCTSGHGVCGMSRLSPRSLIATVTFIASGMATVAVVNALGGGWS